MKNIYQDSQCGFSPGSFDLPPHPRLFLTGGHIPVIRGNVQSGILKDVWRRVLTDAQTVGAGDIGPDAQKPVLRAIEANALAYILDGQREAGEKAVEMAERLLRVVVIAKERQDITRWIGEIITACSLVYDWCYLLMDNRQRHFFIERFKGLAADMEVGYPPLLQGAVVGHGGEAQIFRDLLSAGIACYDECAEIFDFAIRRIVHEFAPARNFYYPSGAHHEGDSYGQYRYQWELLCALILTRLGLENPFVPEQADVAYQWLYMRRPDGALLRDGDSYMGDSRPPHTYWTFQHCLLYHQSLYRDPYSNDEFLRQYEMRPNEVEPVWLVLFFDPQTGRRPSAELPLTRYLPGPAGMMYARTGWGRDAACVKMKIGEWMFNNHQHHDSGSFEIFYKGALATDSGIYEGKSGGYFCEEDRYYNKRTIAHNCLLIFDPGEVIAMTHESLEQECRVNDGGQRVPNKRIEPLLISEALQNPGEYRVARVEAAAFGPDMLAPGYSYIKGDLTNAYAKSKVEKVTRSMVFLNRKEPEYPAVMLVYDVVRKTRASHKTTWLLHSIEEPRLGPGTATVDSPRHGWGGKLVQQNLLPGDGAVAVKIGGPGREFEVNGVRYTQIPKREEHEGMGWRVELSPARPAQTDRFLQVMHIIDADKEPVVAEGIYCGNMNGALAGNQAVLFSADGEAIEDCVSFALPGAGASVLMTDLADGIWAVCRPDGESRHLMAQNGCLYLEDAGPGRYILKREDLSAGGDKA